MGNSVAASSGRSYSTNDSLLENKKKVDYNGFHPALSKQQWAKFYEDTDAQMEDGTLEAGANYYFSTRLNGSAPTLVIFDYDPNRKNTRKLRAAYRDQSVLNDQIIEWESKYGDKNDVASLWGEINDSHARKGILKFNVRTGRYSTVRSSKGGRSELSQNSSEGSRNRKGRQGFQGQDLGDGGAALERVAHSLNDDAHTRAQAQKLADGEIGSQKGNEKRKSLIVSPPWAEADNIGGLPKKSQGGMPLKKKQHCPVCGKWLCPRCDSACEVEFL